MMMHITSSILYPKECLDNNDEGKVSVKFLIEADGFVKSPEVIKSSGHKLLDEETIRIVKEMPQWISARQNDNTVDSECTLPIHFRVG